MLHKYISSYDTHSLLGILSSCGSRRPSAGARHMANIRTAMLARKTPRRVTEATLARRAAIVVGDAVVSAVAAAASSGDDAIVSSALSHSNHTQRNYFALVIITNKVYSCFNLSPVSRLCDAYPEQEKTGLFSSIHYFQNHV